MQTSHLVPCPVREIKPYFAALHYCHTRYDNLSRLASATTPNWNLAWTYDEYGNRLTQSGSSSSGQPAVPTSSFGYDPTTNRISNSGYSYDANGNTAALPGQAFTYDVMDRLTGTGSNTISYDAFGRRIAKTFSDGSTHVYFYDTLGRLTTEARYHLSSGQMVAWNSPVAVYDYLADQRVGQWTDRVGTTRYANGAWEHHYPYGEEITSTANDTFKFAGTYRDSDSSLDYAINRYYANSMGRFLNPDPTGNAHTTAPKSWNQYAYAGNDPANNNDPTGACWLDVDQDGIASYVCQSDFVISGNVPETTFDAMIALTLANITAAISNSLAAAAGSGGGSSGAPTKPIASPKYALPVPTELGFVNDCYYTSGQSSSGTYELEMEYQVLSQFGQPISGGFPALQNVVVTESITTKTGPTIVGGGVWTEPLTLSTNGIFWDTLFQGSSAGAQTSTTNQSFYINGQLAKVVNLLHIPNTINTTVLPGVISPTLVTVDGIVATKQCSQVPGSPTP